MYYLKTRYYDPTLGRFMTIDGIEYLDPETINGLNLYAYCNNNPVMYVDPNGNKWWNPASWNWGKIGRFIGGVALAVVGAAITIASIPIALVVPGGGFIMQAGFSIGMYGGFMVGSVFDPAIKADMDVIGWNPFNNNETLVLNSSKVSFYKGMPTLWTNQSNGRPGSFMGIWLAGNPDEDTIRHEWGHGVQQGFLGPAKYLAYVMLPSWKEWSSRPYYDRPWEITADIFGGVSRNQHQRISRGWNYMLTALFFGPVSYFFLIGEYQ